MPILYGFILSTRNALRYRRATWCVSRLRSADFINRVWVTDGIRPGIIACSHHLGRWRLEAGQGTDRWASALVELAKVDDGIWRMQQLQGIQPV